MIRKSGYLFGLSLSCLPVLRLLPGFLFLLGFFYSLLRCSFFASSFQLCLSIFYFISLLFSLFAICSAGTKREREFLRDSGADSGVN
jgi:hypothetical protein